MILILTEMHLLELEYGEELRLMRDIDILLDWLEWCFIKFIRE